ncbi:MAG: RelA/SpoT family protein [Anaerolineales bacterium]
MQRVEDAYMELAAQLDYLTPGERETIARAFAFAWESHGEQQRKSGNPYIMHPLAVAKMLAELRMDAATVAAALLHDVIEDTTITYAGMEERFGREVAQLVLGVTKLGEQVKELNLVRTPQGSELTYEEREAASLVNLFLSMAEDLRVIVIKLLDRLHNMQTLHYLKPSKQRQKARETQELFVPVAARLGIRQVEETLDDLSLRVLEPEAYTEIQEMLEARVRLLRRDLQDTLTHLRHKLREDGVQATVTVLPESIPNLYRHIQENGWESARTYDGLRIQILVDSRTACYAALGSVHELWTPIPGRITDFIAAPQEGLYRSLHTVVIGLRGHPLEIRIRTRHMHHMAAYGVVGYMQQACGAQSAASLEPKLTWLAHVQEFPDDDPKAFLDLFKSEITPKRIRVFTPKGDVIEMPTGSTPVDFAYAIHTEVGDRCRRALINNEHVPLNRPLKNGDQVEIVKALSPGPDRRWLDEDLGYTTNPYTLRHIRRWFARQPQEEIAVQGQTLIEDELRRWNATESIQRLGRTRGLTEAQLIQKVGRGEISAHELGTFILEMLLDRTEGRPGLLTLEIQAMDRPHLLRDACQVVADDDVNMHSAWARANPETGLALVQLTLDAPTLRKVVRIAHRLEQMLSVMEVRCCNTEAEPSCIEPFILPASISTNLA